MASPTQWTWIWVNSWCWHWTGRPGVQQSMRSQKIRHDWATELNCILLHKLLDLSFMSLVAQMVKNLPAMWETQFQSLGQKDPRRREWQPVLVFLPREFHGQRSLAVYSPRGHKESNMTEWLILSFSFMDRFTSTLHQKVYEVHCYMIKHKVPPSPPNFSLLFESLVLFIIVEPTFSFK